jgi:hypothetical protein
MGQDTRTDSIGISRDHSQVRRTRDVIADLARGNPVDADTLAKTKQTLLDSLASTSIATSERSQQELVVVFASSPNDADRAEMIGRLVAVGEKAMRILDLISHLGLPSGFTSPELSHLKDHLNLSIRERLKVCLDWLAEESEKPDDKKDYPAREQDTRNDRNYPATNDDRKAVFPKKESDDEKEEKEQPALQDPPGLDQIIKDPNSPWDVRMDAVLELGEAAIRPLIALLGEGDSAQQRFASDALNELGSHPETARAVYEAARRLESNPEFRSLAREMRTNIEGQGAGSGSGRQHGAHNTPVVDGWLRNAIDRCDAPSIMKAAAGRESLALPLVTKRLCELRTKRRN